MQWLLKKLDVWINLALWPWFCPFAKVWSEIKETTFRIGHFMNISGHSIANYINSFHKTEVPMVILRCLMSQNLNWTKRYDINYKLFWQLCFSILEEKKVKFKFQKWPFFHHFWSLFCHLHSIFHKTEILAVILRCLGCPNFNLIKSYDMLLLKIFIFHASFLR